jgi:hypothetical protein
LGVTATFTFGFALKGETKGKGCGRAMRFKSSLVPRCGLFTSIPHAKKNHNILFQIEN